MSTNYRYQEQFAASLAKAWKDGKGEYVRNTIRGLKNKSQSAYIAAAVAVNIAFYSENAARAFTDYIHPNEGRQ